MAKKRDQVKRRRQIAKTRKGSHRQPRAKASPGQRPRPEEKASGTDIWIAVGIVVLVVAAFLALYHFAVRRPRTATEPTRPPKPIEAPAEGGAVPSAEDKMSWPEPPPMSIDLSKSYQALIVTEKGDVLLELYADRAPVTVNNFVFLARQGFYDGVTFHRVIPGFMAQTGDPTGTGSGGPGYRFDDEFHPTLRHDSEGIVSMANAGANTNGSQFFIIYAPQPHLDDQHSVFGKVIEGMEVVRSLTPTSPDAGPGDKIMTIEIIEE